MPDTDHNHSHADSIHNNPEWLLKAGLWIAVLILVFLFILAILSGTAFAHFNMCNAYPLLAAIFAFGAALAGAFIGGGAAARGQFGTFEYSVKGGVAFLFISFATFMAARPGANLCEPEPLRDKEVKLFFQNAPSQLEFGGLLNTFWRQDRQDGEKKTLFILARNEPLNAELTLALPNKSNTTECTINIQTAKAVADVRDRDIYDEVKFADGENILFLADRYWVNDFEHRQENPTAQTKQTSACFRYEGRYIDGSFVVVPNEGKLLIAKTQVFGLYPTVDPVERSISRYSNFIVSANAQVAPGNIIPFFELKKSLSDPDVNTRTTAQTYLAQKFADYETEVNAELFLPNQNPDYICGLLEGLIGGIDATGSAFVPGRRRDLSKGIRLLQGKEKDIVTMSGSENISLRKQVRILVYESKQES